MWRCSTDTQIPDPVERRSLFTLDQVYNYYFKNVANPHFIEIGGFDGHTHSNTSLLADDGWSGYYFEPVPEYAQLCRERHLHNTRIEVYEYAVSDSKKTVKLNVDGEWSAISDDGKLEVAAYPLSYVLDFSKAMISRDPDLLVIDVEGHELVAVSNSDIDTVHKPRMCIIEMHEELSPGWEHVGPTNKLIADYMEHAGYTNVWFDYINTIWLHSTLIEEFGNFFEGIVK